MMTDSKRISIHEAAKILGVSLDTLRRWDKTGKLIALRTLGNQRRYSLESLQTITPKDLFSLAERWATSPVPEPLIPSLYYQNRAQFETCLHEMETILSQKKEIKHTASLITSTTGEIGNNSFDHNLGNWRDAPGIFFGFDLSKKQIVLADRGQGILKTLKRVRPELMNDEDAIYVAFTEVVTGRAPERRGNGLKFVRRVVEMGAVSLTFQSGTAKFVMKTGSSKFSIHRNDNFLHGCLAQLTF